MAKTYAIDTNAPFVLTKPETGEIVRTFSSEFVNQTLTAMKKKAAGDASALASLIDLAIAKTKKEKKEKEDIDVEVLQECVDNCRDVDGSKFLVAVQGAYQNHDTTRGQKVTVSDITGLLRTGVVHRD